MAERPDWLAVHQFWFPPGLETRGLDEHRRMAAWWFRGGATPELPPFAPLVEAGASGRLEHWAETPHGRLSLILVLDQFPRGLFAGTARAYALDPHALRLVEEGMRNGHYAALKHPWERLFFELPLVHAEGPGHPDRARRAAALAQEAVEQVAPDLRPIYQMSAAQARGHLDVILRFGRFPHRNAVLGRRSTPEEKAYLEKGEFVHLRKLP